MADYYTIITNLGAAMIAESIEQGSQINFSEIAVGDADYEPNAYQTSLQSEKYRFSVNNVYRPNDNPEWVVIEGFIPADVGGWYIREVGVFTTNGNMFAIGKYPPTYKPVLAEGSGKDLYIRVILEVSSDANVNVELDPSLILATQKYVDDSITNLQQLLEDEVRLTRFFTWR